MAIATGGEKSKLTVIAVMSVGLIVIRRFGRREGGLHRSLS
jgi:hypothetical protein